MFTMFNVCILDVFDDNINESSILSIFSTEVSLFFNEDIQQLSTCLWSKLVKSSLITFIENSANRGSADQNTSKKLN